MVVSGVFTRFVSSLPFLLALWCGGVVWCGVVWCGVVWCGMVWCGVVWCGTSNLQSVVNESRMFGSIWQGSGRPNSLSRRYWYLETDHHHRPQVRRLPLIPDRMVRITLHSRCSMGAALAAIAAYGLVNRYPEYKDRLYIIFLGAPRFARNEFARWLNTELAGRIMQYVVRCCSLFVVLTLYCYVVASS